VTTAPDGSPFDLYLRLPSFGEAEQIQGLVPPGASVLELGCGVGRVTHELVRLGHPVTRAPGRRAPAERRARRESHLGGGASILEAIVPA
jgi:hypothetical protein